MKLSNSLTQVLVRQIATPSELALGVSFIPCRYNGHRGLDLGQINRVGPDYRFFGPIKVASNPDVFKQDYGYPVYFKSIDGMVKCVVPNNPENVALLEALSLSRPHKTTVKNGVTVTEIDKAAPPLYERLDTSEGNVDLGDMSREEKLSLAAMLMRSLQASGDLPSDIEAPKATEPATPGPLDGPRASEGEPSGIRQNRGRG